MRGDCGGLASAFDSWRGEDRCVPIGGGRVTIGGKISRPGSSARLAQGRRINGMAPSVMPHGSELA